MSAPATYRDALQEHREILTEKERAVFDLLLRGLSQRQTALALGITRSAVQSRFETGAKRLRDAVAETEDALERESSSHDG